MDLKKVSKFAEVRSYQLLGNLMRDLGQGAEALRYYRQGQEVGQQRSDKYPDNDISRGNIGAVLSAQGQVLLALNGDAQGSLAAYRQARELFQEIFDHPRDRGLPVSKCKFYLALCDCGMAKAYVSLGDPAAARKYLEESRTYREERTRTEPKNPEAWSYLAESHLWLGIVAWHLGDAAGVEQQFGKAVEICEELARRDPGEFSQKEDLADIYGARGDAQLRLGKVDQAASSYAQALRNIQAVVKRFPDAVSPLPLLALTHERACRTRTAPWQPRGEAEKQYRTALELRDELMQIEPKNLAWQASHALALARCGKHEQAATEAEKLRKAAQRSTELLLQAARCFAVCASVDTPAEKQYLAKALDALAEAVKENYRDATALETDPELEVLRAEAPYQALLAAVKKRS